MNKQDLLDIGVQKVIVDMTENISKKSLDDYPSLSSESLYFSFHCVNSHYTDNTLRFNVGHGDTNMMCPLCGGVASLVIESKTEEDE